MDKKDLKDGKLLQTMCVKTANIAVLGVNVHLV